MAEKLVAETDGFQLVVEYRRPYGCIGSQRRTRKYPIQKSEGTFERALEKGYIELWPGERATIVGIYEGEEYEVGRFVEIDGELCESAA